MTVHYEWDIEVVDVASGDVEDHIFFPTYSEIVAFSRQQAASAGQRYDVVLVRTDDKGREWAYLRDGALPEYFREAYESEGTRVPARFHAEVEQLGK